MSLQRSGRGSLNYLGVEASQPPQFLYMKRAPTTNDSLNVNIGTLWLYSNYPAASPIIYEVYILADLRNGRATWLQIYPVSGLGLEFVTDNGTAEPLDGIINFKEAAAAQGTMTFQGSGNSVSVNFTDNDTALDTGVGLNSLAANTGANNANLTAFGANTLRSATGVSGCSAFGVRALQSLTTPALDCDAFGVEALTAATTATRCQAFGRSSLKVLTTGNHCCAFGTSSQRLNVTGSYNSSFGDSSLGNTLSSNSSAFGASCLTNATSGPNDGFGSECLTLTTTGVNNCSFGYQSLRSNTDKSNNTAMGYQALKSSVLSSGSTAVGYQSQLNINTSGFNDSFGASSLSSATSGGGNVAIGASSLTALISGQFNTCVGIGSGSNYTGSESSNICIGNNVTGLVGETGSIRIGSVGTTGETSNTIKIGTSDAQFIAIGHSNSTLIAERNGIRIGFIAEGGGSPASPFNYILIGGLAYINDAFNSPIKIGYKNAGTIAIGADVVDTSPNYSINIGTLGQQVTCLIQGIFGVTVNAGTGTAVFVDSTGKLGTVVSSARYKDNIADIGDQSSFLMKLRPVSFTYKQQDPEYVQYGFIAEEVEQICKDLVIYKDGQPETVRYHLLPPLIINELQKQAQTIDALEKRIQLLEQKLNNLI